MKRAYIKFAAGLIFSNRDSGWLVTEFSRKPDYFLLMQLRRFYDKDR